MADSPAIEAVKAELWQRTKDGYLCGFRTGVRECITALGWEKFGYIDPEISDA